jgi:2-desacetyl-2-hydroxyethyl bacteriochlorophyllide A dehydrogenase
MAAYFIGTIDIEDAETFDLYRSLNPSIVEAAGGKYIIKGQPVSSLEGDDFRSRFVMIEFASEAALQRFYNSPEYVALRPLRERSSKSSIAYINTDSASSDLKPVTSTMAELAADDLRIQPTLISLNPVDWKIRSGILAALPFTFPYTPGAEGVGVIEAVGADVNGFRPGQRVMAFSSLLRGGWFANKVDVSANQCALVPDDMSDEQACALSVPLLTAHQAIKLHNGTIERALVIGASGSVGSIATKLLSQITKNVDGICSPSNASHVTSLGGNVIDPEQAAEGQYDFILDAAGGPMIETAYRSLAKGATLVSIVQPVDEARAKAASAQAIRYSAQPDGKQLADLMAEHKDLPAPRVALTLPLAEINTALHLLKFGRVRGKIFLKP